MISIHYQSSTSFDNLSNYAAALRARAREVLGEDADVAFRGLPDSIYGNARPRSRCALTKEVDPNGFDPSNF